MSSYNNIIYIYVCMKVAGPNTFDRNQQIFDKLSLDDDEFTYTSH